MTDNEALDERLREVAGRYAPALAEAVHLAADPEIAITNMRRWLSALSNPETLIEHVAMHPMLARPLLRALGMGHYLADVLTQNPELSDLILDPTSLDRRPTAQGVEADSNRLLESAISLSHAMDRLRYMRQRWNLNIGVADLAERRPPDECWLDLSEVADGLLRSSLEYLWRHFEGPLECPLGIIAFGKLGGSELNYSSDLDLVFVAADETADGLPTRFAERYVRALSDRMGRGHAYRIDLRLRPYGKAGPLVCTWRSLEGYIGRYAERWEHLAMIRSRVVAGPPDLAARWEDVRARTCFPSAVGEWVVDELIEQRARTEGMADPGDFKRGSGGIRDIEFFTQLKQMLHGSRHSSVQERGTLAALEQLRLAGAVSDGDAMRLSEAYTFLRRTEHHCQLIGDLQTHEPPSDPMALKALARSLGSGSAQELTAVLSQVRTEVRAIYSGAFRQPDSRPDYKAQAIDLLGDAAPAALRWLESFDGCEGFFKALLTNEGSFERVRRLVRLAPALINEVQGQVALTEQVFSGEVAEPVPAIQFEALSLADKASVLQRGLLKVGVRWVLSADFQFGFERAKLFDLILRVIQAEEAPSLSILALGSYAAGEMTLSSDIDLLLMRLDGAPHQEAEAQAERLLQAAGQITAFGAPLRIDLRLRPQGRKGSLVHSPAGLDQYRRTDMEPWERLALGHARLVAGEQVALDSACEAAYGKRIASRELEELLAIKHRVETERVWGPHRHRDLKLGEGGLDDLDWMVGLYGLAMNSKICGCKFGERLAAMADLAQISAAERAQLAMARNRLVQMRVWISLLGYEADIVPENPEKLGRLAEAMGHSHANAFLEEHTSLATFVRSQYLDAVAGLREML